MTDAERGRRSSDEERRREREGERHDDRDEAAGDRGEGRGGAGPRGETDAVTQADAGLAGGSGADREGAEANPSTSPEGPGRAEGSSGDEDRGGDRDHGD